MLWTLFVRAGGHRLCSSDFNRRDFYTNKTRRRGLKIRMLWTLFVRAGGHRLCSSDFNRRDFCGHYYLSAPADIVCVAAISIAGISVDIVCIAAISIAEISFSPQP